MNSLCVWCWSIGKLDGILRSTLIIVAFMVLLSGCTSGFKTVLPGLPEKYEKLGNASGSACGSLLIDGAAYYAIPISMMFNSRVDRAYQHALESVPGSTALMNVTLQENWYWWVLGSARCVTITGEAIR